LERAGAAPVATTSPTLSKRRRCEPCWSWRSTASSTEWYLRAIGEAKLNKPLMDELGAMDCDRSSVAETKAADWDG